MVAAVAAVALVVVLVVLGLALFGGSEEEATELLDRAFETPIGSADVAIDTSLEINGVRQLEQPVRLQIRGPYRSGSNRTIPQFDLAINFSGGGQNFAAGLVSSGQNAWVEFLGQAYEVGAQQVATVNQQIATGAARQQSRSLREFGVDPRSWLEDPSIEGDEEIAGAETQHVSAGINVGRMLEDLNTVGQRASGQVGGGGAARQLSAEQRERIERIVQDPEFDVYVGEDNRVRRLSTVLDLEVPEEDRRESGGATSGKVAFSAEFSNVGSPQAITPPQQARPINDLVTQLSQLFGGGAAAPGGGAAPGGAAPGGAPLVTVAHLVARKRHADVLRALWLLRDAHPRVRWVVVGDGPERPRLEALARELGLAERVAFRGALPHAEAVAAARDAAAFVLPSVDEAFGVAYVEAMAGGIPAVGCRGEGGPEEIAAAGGGIRLVPPGDPERLAEELRGLIEDAGWRRELGKAARATVLAHFTWAGCGRETVAAYEAALR